MPESVTGKRDPIGALHGFPRHGQGNGAVLGELGGIAQQVEQHLPHLGQVGVHGADVRGAVDGERIVLLLHQGLHRVDDILEHGSNIKGLRIHFHLARFDLRKVEHIVDEGQQLLPRGVDLFEIRDEVLGARIFGFFLQEFTI